MVPSGVVLVVETNRSSLGPYEQLVCWSVVEQVSSLKIEFVVIGLVVRHVESDFVSGARHVNYPLAVIASPDGSGVGRCSIINPTPQPPRSG